MQAIAANSSGGQFGRSRLRSARVQIDLDFELLTLDGEVFNARRLLGRPTILVLLRYLG